jgi:hypothetical protein
MATLIDKETMKFHENLMVTYSGRISKSKRQYVIMMDMREFTNVIHAIIHDSKEEGIQK